MTEKNKTIAVSAALCAVTLFAGVTVFAWTLVPYLQMAHYDTAANNPGGDLTADAFIFSPFTYAQEGLRKYALSELLGEYDAGTATTATPTLDLLVAKSAELSKRFPYRYDFLVTTGKGYDIESDLRNDPGLLATAQAYYEQAQQLVPGRQEGAYLLAINLLKQGKTDDGITMLKGLVAANPEIGSNHYELAEAYVVSGGQYYDDSLAEFELALDKGSNLNPNVTLESYKIFMKQYYQLGDIPRFTLAVKRLVTLDPVQAAQYQAVLKYISDTGTIPVITMSSSSS